MELSEEDRNAFHNQADRVANEIDDEFKEVNRTDSERSVRSVFMALDDEENTVMVTMKVLPRHGFLVKEMGGERTRTTRRDDVVETINDTLS